MAVVGILFVAQVLEEIGLHVAVRNLRRLVGHPVEILADEVKVLLAIERGLLFGQFARRPFVEERVVLAVLFVAPRGQLLAESRHGVTSWFPKVCQKSRSLQSR